jgi:hypothetical protein
VGRGPGTAGLPGLDRRRWDRHRQGRDGRDAIERGTGELATGPWRVLGEDQAARLTDLVFPVLEAALLTGLFPPDTTLGIGKIPGPVWT